MPTEDRVSDYRSPEDISLAQAIQHLALTLDLKMDKIGADVAHLRESVDGKIESIREALLHADQMNEAKLEAIVKDQESAMTELERFEQAMADRQKKITEMFESLDKRLSDLEGKDIQERAKRFDNAQKWIITALLGSVAGWITVNAQALIGWLTSFPKGGGNP